LKNIFLFFLFLLLSFALGANAQTEFQPKVFVCGNFFFPKHDTPIGDKNVSGFVDFLPTNLPRVVTTGNDWWEEGDRYIPKNWPIPNHDLNIGQWFGWYLHNADRAKFGSSRQIDLFPVPDSIKAFWKKQKSDEVPVPDTLKWGTMLDGMTFSRSQNDMVVCPTTVWLGINGQDLAIHKFRPVKFDGWVYQLGFVFDCNNHFFWKWKLPETPTPPQKVAPPEESAPVPELSPPLKVLAPQPHKKIFAELALWGGVIQSQMDGIGKTIANHLQMLGQESSLTFGEDRQTSFWLNSTSEYWQEKNLNESLSPNWFTQSGFQFSISIGPQNRFYLRNGVLKTGVNWGVRYAYERSQQFLRPRINLEKYAVIGKFGFQTEADALLSIDKKWQEQVYFGNAGIFYSPKYRTKYWLGIEYTKVSAGEGEGAYFSSGTFAVAKWESVFGMDWLTLIGKYRFEQTEVNHIYYSDPPHVLYGYTDNFEGVRWGIFAAIAIKR